MSAQDVKRVAIALWNITRRELQTGETEPAFHTYADGACEPMPFHKQNANFQKFWRRRARCVLRALRRRETNRRGSTGYEGYAVSSLRSILSTARRNLSKADDLFKKDYREIITVVSAEFHRRGLKVPQPRPTTAGAEAR